MWPSHTVFKSIKVTGSVTDRLATCDFSDPSNHWPISHRFQDKRRLRSKVAKFSRLRVFNTPLKRFQLELCKGGGAQRTRSSADADNWLDAFSGQSRSTNMVPFHMLHIVSYCAIVTLSLRRAFFTIFVFKKFHDLEMGVKGHSRSLRVVSFDRLCMVSY